LNAISGTKTICGPSAGERFANAAAAALFGYARPEELIGLDWDQFVSAEDLPD